MEIREEYQLCTMNTTYRARTGVLKKLRTCVDLSELPVNIPVPGAPPSTPVNVVPSRLVCTVKPVTHSS